MLPQRRRVVPKLDQMSAAAILAGLVASLPGRMIRLWTLQNSR